jgi:hypothetical protein
MFSAEGKYYYFDANPVRELCTLDLKNWIFFLQVSWYEARDYCAERGMKLASVKTQHQMGEVIVRLRDTYGFSKIQSKVEILIFTSFSLLQHSLVTGCRCRTLVGRLDNTAGRMALQWTNKLGTLDNQIVLAPEMRLASTCALTLKNYLMWAAHTTGSPCAMFLSHSPRAFNQMCSTYQQLTPNYYHMIQKQGKLSSTQSMVNKVTRWTFFSNFI